MWVAPLSRGSTHISKFNNLDDWQWDDSALGLAGPRHHRSLPPQLEKDSLLRRGAAKTAAIPCSPKGQVFCSAADQSCPGSNLVQILSPRPSPWLGCRTQGGRRQSSLLIYSQHSLGEAGVKNLLELWCQKVLGGSTGLMGT